MSDLVDSIRPLLPPSWSSMSSATSVELVELASYTSEYTIVQLKSSVAPTRIVRVQNPYLWGCYTLRKEEAMKRHSGVVREMELWHATSPVYVDSIVRDNFDWRRSSRAKFGQGVCFSPDSSYANRYCTQGGALILSKVLVGHCTSGSDLTVLPNPRINDTTTGNLEKVYVKYYDHEFYPEYVVYYNYVKPVGKRRWY